MEDILRSFTSVKVVIPYHRNTLLQVKVLHSICTKEKVEKYQHRNTLKVLKVKVLIMQNNIYDIVLELLIINVFITLMLQLVKVELVAAGSL